MRVFCSGNKGFATAVIVGGVVVATVVGGVLYFLRGGDFTPDTLPREDDAEVREEVGDTQGDVDEVLFRGLSQNAKKDYCSVLGLAGDVCLSGAADACRRLLAEHDTARCADEDNSLQSLLEACLILGNPASQALYAAWLASDTDRCFPFYYAVFGLDRDTFDVKTLADAYRARLNAYHADLSCTDRGSLRLLAEAYLTLSNLEGRGAYNEWVDSCDGTVFPLYYAIFGLDKDSFTQEELANEFQRLVGLYRSGFYGDNPEVLQLLIEAYLALRDDSLREVYDLILDGRLSADTLGIPSGGSGVVFGELDTSLDDLGITPDDLGLSFSDFGIGLGDFGLTLDDFGFSFDSFGIGFDDLNIDFADIGVAPDDLGITPGDLGITLESLIGPNDYGVTLDDLGVSFEDLGIGFQNLGISLADLGISPDDFGFSFADFGIGFADLGISPSDLGISLDNLDISFADLGIGFGDLGIGSGTFESAFAAGNFNFSLSDLGIDPGDLNISTDALGEIVLNPNTGTFTFGDSGISPSDLNISLGALGEIVLNPNTGTFTFGDSGISPSDLNISLNALSEIVLNIDIGAVLANAGISLTGIISSIDASVLSGLTFDSSTIATVNTAVTEYISGNQYVNPFVSNFNILRNIVTAPFSGDSSPEDPDDDETGPDDDPSDLPAVSLSVVDRVIELGEEAEFTVTVSGNAPATLGVFYTCKDSTPDLITDASYYGEKRIFIPQDTESKNIPSIQTRDQGPGYVRCAIIDDSDSYTIGVRSGSVSVGIVGGLADEDEDFDPSLPTVSIVAYDKKPGGTAVELITRAVIDTKSAHFGFVIEEPKIPFSVASLDDDALTGTLEEVKSGEKYALYVDDNDNRVFVTSDLVLGTMGAGLEYSYPGESGVIPLLNQFVYKSSDRVWLITTPSEEDSRFCSKDEGGRTFCGTFDGEDDLATAAFLSVGVQCFRDFLPEANREREVVEPLIGGRHLVPDTNTYAKEVRGYNGAGGLNGNLYEFILPTDHYFDPRAQVYFPLETDLHSALGTVSCEIVGGEDAGYNVAARRASLRIHPQPIVSIEGKRGEDNPDPAGEPVALVRYGERTYDFENTALKESSGALLKTDGTADKPITWGDLGKSIGTGFLVGFGTCYAAGLLNKGLNIVTSALGLGGELPVTDSTLTAKECALDVAVSDIVMNIITSTAADYIAWAHEGFKDKPLFVQNPTTFYKNVRDDAIGRAIDRSGLGFLCDVKFSGFDPSFNAKIRLELQNRYSEVRIQPPRCTYDKLTNNLDKFFGDIEDFALDEHGSLAIGDVDSFVEDFTFALLDTPPSLDIRPSGRIVDFTPTRSEAGDRLDALSEELENNLERVQNTGNFLLSLARVDAAVDQATREVDSVATPPGQLFNPNNPRSLAAFQKCSEEENPEGAEDCYILKADASSVDDRFNAAINAPSERLETIDEWGEIGELTKLVVEATSVGLFKNLLTNETGHAVPRKTLQTLRQTELAGSGKAGRFGVSEYGLSKHWWSAFFEDNEYYNDIIGAEMYAGDENDLFRYISASFYRSSLADGSGGKLYVPPTGIYTDFDAVSHQRYGSGGVCKNSTGGHGPYSKYIINPRCRAPYRQWKNTEQSEIDSHYSGVFNSDGDPDKAFKEGFWRGFFTRDGWVKRLLDYLYGNDDCGDDASSSDCVRYRKKVLLIDRFRDAYTFLSDIATRAEYDAFLERIGFSGFANIVEKPYLKEGSVWEKDLTEDSVPSFVDEFFRSPYDSQYNFSRQKSDLLNALYVHAGSLNNSNPTISYPTQSGGLRGALFGSGLYDGLENRVAALQALRDVYEATLAAHIELVGTPDEYSGYEKVDSKAYNYRKDILDKSVQRGKSWSTAFEAWKIVRDETLKNFRDGNLTIYVPVQEYPDDLQKTSRGLGVYSGLSCDPKSGDTKPAEFPADFEPPKTPEECSEGLNIVSEARCEVTEWRERFHPANYTCKNKEAVKKDKCRISTRVIVGTDLGTEYLELPCSDLGSAAIFHPVVYEVCGEE